MSLVAILIAVVFAQDPVAPVESPPAPAPAARYVGPRIGKARDAALAKYGGSKATEASIAAGLDWLVRHQSDDGRFDPDGFPARCADGAKCDGIGKGQHGEEIPCPFDDAITALAALAFLGHGELPDENGTPSARALAHALGALESPRDRWTLALATQAFSELAAMDPTRKDAASKARALVGRLLATRQEDGAFGYAAPYRHGSDVPYTALAVEALVAARDAGFELPEDFGEGIDRFLGSLEARGGDLAYLVDGRKYGYTPTATNGHAAAAIRELLDLETDAPRHRAHLALVARERPVWKLAFETIDVPGRGPMQVQVGNLSLYQWWYGTTASFERGGAAWTNWWSALKPALLEHQRKDGCAKGSWNPEGTYERQTGGRVMATALAVLMLESPYRLARGK